MFSDWIQALYRVKNGILKQRKAALAYLAWSLLCIYGGIRNFSNMYQSYQITLSAADMLILMQHYWEFGIKLLPAATLLVMRCKQESLNVQFLVRYGSRAHMLCRQAKESVIYAAGTAFAVMLPEAVIAYGKGLQAINWEQQDSLYYSRTGTLISAQFALIFIGVWLMYIVKLMIVLGCLDVLLWYPKYLFFLWIGLIAAAGAEWLDMKVYHQLFAIQYSLWQTPWKHILLFVLGAGVICAEYSIGRGMIQKRDVF